MKISNLDLTIPQDISLSEDCDLRGIFIGKGDQNIKTKISFSHTQPNIKSRITIKAVLYDQSKFDFEGILKINKGAENTDTYLKIDCLVIGDGAMARAIPSLEINESAVKAGHGATIGYLDKDLLYYLMSKGLDNKQAEELIVAAFINS